MLLLIDIGNTSTTLGVCTGTTISATGRFMTSVCQDRHGFTVSVEAFLRQHQLSGPSGAVLCSVVPAVTSAAVETMKKDFDVEPVVVSSTIKTGLTFLITNPADLGADRIANAAGAHALYGGNLVVIDVGTATTLCVITGEGVYRGGVIMPGPGMSAEALAERTAKLPRVTLTPPKSVLGDDTESHIISGILYGHAGAVERCVTEIRNETGLDLTVILTGGYAGLILPYVQADHYDPDLTLQGLRVLHELNAGR